MSILNSAYETAKAWGESAKNAATTAGNAVANAATTAGNAAANAATTAGRAAANTASAAGHAVANAATTAGNAVADAATATGRAAVNTATAAGNAVADAATATGRAAVNTATAAGNAVAKAGNAAVDAATTAGNAIADAATATGRAAVNTATAAGNAVADAATATGRAAVSTATAAGNAVGNAATTAGNAVMNAATTAGNAVTNAATTAGNVAMDAAKATGNAAVEAGKAIGNAVVETATEIKDGLIWAAKYTENYLVASIASGVATLAKNIPWAEQCLDTLLAPKGIQPDDGNFMGQDCPQSSKTPPTSGTKPKGCVASGKTFPKIIYTNGINTSAEAACATMHKIADTRCAEVVGIYNATDGIGGDVANANRKINGDTKDPAAIALASLVQDMAEHGDQINMYAHSEGGLNAQTGLGLAREQMNIEHGQAFTNTAMRGINVNSFGTAKRGWPPGPTYRQFTNASDPVPHLIGAAQRGTRDRSFLDAPNTSRYEFKNPHWDPIDSHSMDNTYLDFLNGQFPVPKNANGSCC